MDVGSFYRLDPATLACPYPAYAALRLRQGPTWVPEIDSFVVARFETAMEVLKHPERYSSAAPAGSTLPQQLHDLLNGQRAAAGKEPRPYAPQPAVMLAADPPLHTRQRSFVSRAFSPRRIALLESQIDRAATRLIDRFPAGACDFMAAFAQPLPLQMIAAILGVDDTDLDLLKTWTDALVAPIGVPPLSEEALLSAATSLVDFDSYFRSRIADRRAKPRDDLLSEVVHRELGDAPGLTDDELVIMFAQFLVAGNETSTKMFTFAMWRLAEEPALAKRLRLEPELVPTYLDEVLRLDSPIQGLWRIATEDSELDGVSVPAGSRVLVSFAAANRDETVFPCADRVDVDRPEPRGHLAFGFGTHYCIGAALARGQGRVGMERLLERLDDIALDPSFDPVFTPSFVLRGVDSLPITYRLR